ncbi:phospholipase A2 inhibitor beta-like [Clytia hemisphaerica]|uniref:EGF-like domain-containing protein n=1 Tax=Clytia hemisphaerica TaxID=252671 RepID=A0A7M5V0K4_9CNID|eukprot:TCONS_00034864-protein
MLVLTILAILLVEANAEFTCPSFCSCRATNAIIDCKANEVPKAELEKLFKSLPRELKYFKLRESNLTTIDTSLFARVLPNLQQLHVQANQLKEVPQNLSGVFPALVNLNLIDNQITEIKASDFAGLKDLTKLNLDGNKLTSIGPSTFVSNGKLKVIFVTRNSIEDISPDAFNGLDSLSLLALGSNKINVLKPGVFNSLNNGQILLQENMIEDIGAGLFKAGQNVRKITFNKNKITNIDPSAFDQVEIGFLQISENQLKSIPVKIVNSVSLMDFTGNPLDCTCLMAKFIQAAANQDKLKKINGACDTPDNLKGTQLQSMNVATVNKDLGCTVCDLNNTCLNDAKCVAISDTEHGCECTAEYTGDRCQHQVTTTTTTTTTAVPTTEPPTPAPAPKKDDSGKDDGMTMYIIIAVVVLVILIAVAIFICIRRRRSSPPADANDTLLKPQSTPADVAEKA